MLHKGRQHLPKSDVSSRQTRGPSMPTRWTKQQHLQMSNRFALNIGARHENSPAQLGRFFFTVGVRDCCVHAPGALRATTRFGRRPPIYMPRRVGALLSPASGISRTLLAVPRFCPQQVATARTHRGTPWPLSSCHSCFETQPTGYRTRNICQPRHNDARDHHLGVSSSRS